MRRLCLTIACLASAIAWTQASAKDLSAEPLRSAHAHAAKARRPVVTRSASLDDLNAIRFSNPYAPPDGATVIKRSDLLGGNDFPAYRYPTPREPHGGLSISMGQDGGGHTTGGLSWGF